VCVHYSLTTHALYIYLHYRYEEAVLAGIFEIIKKARDINAPLSHLFPTDRSMDRVPDLTSHPRQRYQSRVRRQRVVFKIEHVEVHELDRARISSLLKSRVEERCRNIEFFFGVGTVQFSICVTYLLLPCRFPECHLQSVSVRTGCVIVELSMVDFGGSRGSSSIVESSLEDWLNVMQDTLHLDSVNGSIVSVKVSLN